ncbi:MULTISPECIES: hypothetical protein [Rhodococcus]|uniref:hypothetical protein n=1 Tax=Rhodococcus TaxID=1827 RepID=UPI000A547ACB|nr:MULTISPECIES: hypothetical protein [Rhodococcus]RZL23989.1 MAG: hypothetical protein EOP31_16135 [Rhodococcus sp. (in: high G+C Gram-positive bacteria)]
MNDDHTKLLAEFRVLADSVLSRIEPIVAQMAEGRTNAAADLETSEELPAFSGCSWCPVCAVAALMRGEHHELLAILAGHAAVLLVLLRELLDEFLGGRAPSDGKTDGGPGGGAPTPDGTSSPKPRSPAFVPITVTVKR